MNRDAVTSSHRFPAVAAAGLLLLGIAAAAFYGWLQFGSSIILSLGETGLSWCF
ncbi:acyl dehydratase [Rhizobium petrolearium]|uniref:hypothetical protein n=1 Tax=Neorhizobium petrolearium TaxID=515361 RepID=UPI001AE83718|nr:hypothetical protein [Neorhizobium petrolearium]MBP1844993.1 acyl dehydratase [Neorhizobium petrolearium]